MEPNHESRWIRIINDIQVRAGTSKQMVCQKKDMQSRIFCQMWSQTRRRINLSTLSFIYHHFASHLVSKMSKADVCNLSPPPDVASLIQSLCVVLSAAYFPLSVLIFQNFFFFFSYVIFLTSFCICKYEPIRMNDFPVIFSGLGIFVPKVNETWSTARKLVLVVRVSFVPWEFVC